MNSRAGVPWHERRDVWVTRDRRVIPIRELDDGHLERIIQFMHNKAVRRYKAHIARAVLRMVDKHITVDSIEYQDSADHFMFDLDRLMAHDPKTGPRRLPVYQALCAEADRRAKAQGYVPAPGEWRPSLRSRVFGPSDDPLDSNWGDDDISGAIRDGSKFTRR